MNDKTQTEQNLKTAFVGESKACLRLLAFAEQAIDEGYPQIAHLFRAISAAERVHALRSLRLLREVASTDANLRQSFEREASISESHYPAFVRLAEQEGNMPAAMAFSQARDAESFHAKLYKSALEHTLGEVATRYHVCQVCGYVGEGEAPDSCPICNARRDKFLQVE